MACWYGRIWWMEDVNIRAGMLPGWQQLWKERISVQRIQGCIWWDVRIRPDRNSLKVKWKKRSGGYIIIRPLWHGWYLMRAGDNSRRGRWQTLLWQKIIPDWLILQADGLIRDVGISKVFMIISSRWISHRKSGWQHLPNSGDTRFRFRSTVCMKKIFTDIRYLKEKKISAERMKNW